MGRVLRSLVLGMALVLGMVMWASAGTVALSWDYPLAEESRIHGYRIYYGPSSQAGVLAAEDQVSALPYGFRVELGNPGLRSHSIVLGPGVYYFRMTAYGMVNGVLADSVFSEEVMVQVGLVTITNLSLTVTYP